MDKNAVREKTVSSFLGGCLKAGIVEQLLNKRYDSEDAVAANKLFEALQAVIGVEAD